MNTFDNIKSEWGQRKLPQSSKNGAQAILRKARYIKKGQTISQIVLLVTVIILVGFFFYISAYNNRQVTYGLLMMISVLILRIVIEFVYRIKLNKFNMTQEVEIFQRQIQRYYTSRLWIHLLITPILFILYIVGFVMLLPAFKQNLSTGFYTYIVYSSVVIFLILAVFIAIQIRKELSILKKLKTR